MVAPDVELPVLGTRFTNTLYELSGFPGKPGGKIWWQPEINNSALGLNVLLD